MCGIAGYSIGPKYAAKLPDLFEVIKVLQHRGPDGHGVFVNDQKDAGLAHVRLSIIDLGEGGAQPMQSSGGRFTLSYNGEIYNYLDLRAELEDAGHEFQGKSDTEVLLQLLQTEWLSALPRLNGMFAFAIYDEKEGEITLVRDAYGVKPLYFSESSEAVFFASEIRGLLEMGVAVKEIAGDTLGKYLTFLWGPGRETPAANIHKLQPGEAMTVKAGRVTRRWTWFSAPIQAPRIVTESSHKLIAKTTKLLRAAVHRQMIADVPVGAFLSGGLDSSAVVAFAREISPDITCYTIEASGGPDEGTADDLPYARRVAEHLNVPLEVVTVVPNRMVEDLERMIWQLEEPLADPACLNVFYISRLAREQGMKVLLSGAGGDDIFTGYRRHRAVALDEKLQRLPSGLRRSLGELGDRLDKSRAPMRRVAKYLDGFGLDGPERLINYFVWAARDDVVSLFAADLREYAGSWDFARPMHDYLGRCSADIAPINKILALEQRFFLADHNLTYTDKMSMAASIEVRVPFLDLELAEFASTLPVAIKQRGKEGKWVLKKSMEPFLPHEVIYRPKSGFGAPLRRWLRGDLNNFMQDLLSDETIKKRGLFDPQAVAKLVNQDMRGEKDGSYTILSLMCIEIWCRFFIDGVKPSWAPR
ncbi:asparagine synthase (glutamine-hydrolyzing) [Gammaproteobacteria bacterium]|nr:asparagine synthase (glutamine-hydrolyzing) [Gammaproteobacteria bacterium]